MKGLMGIWAISAAISICAPAWAVSGNTITVRVSTFRTLKGALRCRLYARADGFPGKPPFLAEQSVTISAKTMTCSFGAVAPGIYAVALFHDENGDGKLETNFLGVPREGVGVSNNKFRRLGPPSWDDAKFTVGGDVVVDVNLRY